MDREQFDEDNIVICPNCQGTGKAFISVLEYIDEYGMEVWREHLETCMLCEGQRAIRKQTTFKSLLN